jgi:hypothetical protein
MAIHVMQFHIERLQQAQDAQTDAAGSHGADVHRFQIVGGARHAVGDISAAFDHPVIGRDIVAHQRERHHHYVFGNAVAVAVGDFGDSNAALHGCLQVGVVRADAGRHDHLEIFCLGDAFGGHVSRPERLRDQCRHRAVRGPERCRRRPCWT